MKNFNKLFGSLILAFGVMACLSLKSSVSASVGVRSPKETYLLNYTTTISTVTPVVSTPTATAAFSPGAVYQVILSTGTQADYFVLWDSTGTVGLALTGAIGTAQFQMTPKLFISSSTSNTVFTFDPPLIFHNGLCVGASSANDTMSVTYELGRGLSGQ